MVLAELPPPELWVGDAAVQEPGQDQSQQMPTPAASSSSSQIPESKIDPDEERRQKAKEQIEQQKSQRLFGIVPMFNTSYRSDAVSLTSGEKMKLAFRSAIDPVNFGVSALVAGIAELNPGPNNSGFGWGADGYGKRWGAAYLDSFDGRMIGKGVLPAIFHQDPRYFRQGRGTTTHRLLYAMATTVICKGDKLRRWQPNYSNLGGNLAAGALSNLYYPSGDKSDWEQTLASGFTVTALGMFGSMFQEFWPDISRKLLKKDPTHGLDAQAREADAKSKEARQARQPLPPSPK
jgi:hypothetical protein